MRNYNEETGLYYEIREDGGRKFAVITDAEKSLADPVIPPVIDGCPVEVIGKKAFLGLKGLRQVTLPPPVKEIQEWAFAFCDNLKRIDLRRGRITLGKGVFKNDKKLKTVMIHEDDTYMDAADNTGKDKGNEAARLLAAATTHMDAEYLLDCEHAGSDEWYNKWDTKLAHILSLADDEGYHLYVLCGEEDLHFDYDQYLEYNREKKAYLCMLRLNNDRALKDGIKEDLKKYLISHSAGCPSEAALKVLLRDYGDDEDYYRLMIDTKAINTGNLEDVLLKMGDRHAGMKAFLMETLRGNAGEERDFFDDLLI